MRIRAVETALICICLASAPATASAQQVQTVPPASSSAPTITLDEAISRAKANEPGFAAAVAASGVSKLDRSIARSALLPSVTYHNQYLYTQGTGTLTAGSTPGTPASPRFIANNAVHEYTSQGVVSETIGVQQFVAASQASAAAALAAANLEIARRGLVSTVVGLFYSSLAAENKVTVAKRAAAEADSFVTLTQQRESARESAHADVVKAQLQQQQRNRDLADAIVLAQKARLDLGVLLFPDPRSPYTVATDPAPPALPARSDVEAAAAHHNPELQSALASLHQSDLAVTAARSAYLPDLALNYSYGIDAAQFAAKNPEGIRNLGYSASATFDIPVWDWFSTQHKVKQSEIMRDAARVALTSTQRQLIAQLDEFYSEAATARDQLESLDLSVKTAAESLRLTRLRYTAGESSVLEVVDAENSLATAELAREDGLTRYHMALANLQLLTGTI
ncbi:TolC family protein [Edaphobacter dinghuensis]|uniref:Histidine kinase n=1 Tax=Edaphobacter dinghuensis TaxID=1560005 RepID=A0A917HNL0_9BACT|nr:TolC family protein [Edaphobacter dinghuensis]GGG85201.1 histidine kinase [Edaphobacter dinghuensis]